MKMEDFLSVIVKPIWKWAVEIFMGLLSVVIYVKPEWTNWLSFSSLIQRYWWVWLVVGSLILVVSTAREATRKMGEIREAARSLPSENYSFLNSKNIVGKQSAKEIKNYFGSNENGIEKDNEQEIVFHRTFYHREFYVHEATPEQVLNYIRKDVSGSLWFINVRDDFFYDVDSSKTEFFYPGKNNVPVHGIFFHVVKWDAEQRNGLIQRGKGGNHIRRLFWLSITPVGVGEKIRLQVDFETQDQDAVEFLNVTKKRLGKLFKITDDKVIIFGA